MTSPLKYNELFNGKLPSDGGIIAAPVVHKTRYVPDGITHPGGTITFTPDNVGSGMSLLAIEVVQGVLSPILIVIFVILPPTPANGIHTV